MEKSKRETPLAIPFNDGFICPKCMGVCIGEKWRHSLKYCPRCGQRINLLEPAEWMRLKNRVRRMEDIKEHPDVVELIRYENGLDIAGVYIDVLEALQRREEKGCSFTE